MGRHQATELAIFHDFVRSGPFRAVPGSVSGRPEPEPDILCDVVGTGLTAFELVQVVSQPLKRQIEVMLNEVRASLERAFANLSIPDQRRLAKKYPACNISLGFDESLAKTRRQRIIPGVFDVLLDPTLKPDDLGVFDRESVPALPIGLEYIRVTRTSGAEISFRQVAMASYQDPSGPTILRKFRDKSYKSNHPIELLAYYELEFTPDAGRLRRIGELVSRSLHESQFARVWAYSVPAKQVLGVWPPFGIS